MSTVTDQDIALTDSLGSHLEARVARLEQVAAARRPWRWILAARLRRQLRASVRHFPGRRWVDRRTHAVTADWLTS